MEYDPPKNEQYSNYVAAMSPMNDASCSYDDRILWLLIEFCEDNKTDVLFYLELLEPEDNFYSSYQNLKRLGYVLVDE